MSSAYLLQDNVCPMSSSDPDNRDPTQMNKHLQLGFFNVIAEPDTSAYNFAALHNVSHQIYHYTKVFTYRLLTVFIGLPLMVCWGLLFGVYTFAMIWLAVPMRRLFQSMIAESGAYVQTLSDAMIAPLCRSSGQVFSSIRMSLFKQETHSAKQIQV